MKQIDLGRLLEHQEFLSVATCDLDAVPNAAPKFLLKVERSTLYLVDYTIGKTWRNVRKNPRASVSFMDHSSLTGYQLNGTVRIIQKGPVYEKMRREMTEKEVRLTAKRIIEEVAGKSTHEHFEAGITERFIVLKMAVQEVVRMDHRGQVVRSTTGEV